MNFKQTYNQINRRLHVLAARNMTNQLNVTIFRFSKTKSIFIKCVRHLNLVRYGRFRPVSKNIPKVRMVSFAGAEMVRASGHIRHGFRLRRSAVRMYRFQRLVHDDGDRHPRPGRRAPLQQTRGDSTLCLLFISRLLRVHDESY